MNHSPDVDLVLRDYFADDGLTAPDYILDVVEGRIGRQPQRRSWGLPWRNPMSTPVKLAAGLAAVIVVAVLSYNLLPGQGDVGRRPTAPPTTAPTTAPTSSPLPIRDGALTEGRYQMEAFGLSIVADVPEGWYGAPTPFLTSTAEFNEDNVLITLMRVDGLYSDACHWDLDGSGLAAQPGDVEVGPSVDDLVDALRANTSYTASTPIPVTFGSYQGQTLELQLPGDDVLSTCDREAEDATGSSYFVFPGAGIYAQGPDNRWQLYIVEVEGTRVIILLSYFDGIPQADLEAARAIVESFEFTP
jgi:hypothetical protein